MFDKKRFRNFLIIFLLVFALFYLGTLAVIGLAAPGGYYSNFIAKYFDFVSGIKNTLIVGTQNLLALFNIQTYRVPGFIVRIQNGTGVTIAMDCVGYGVMSFWAAFVIASRVALKKSLLWILLGFVIIWIINVIRISLLLLAYNRHWAMPFGIDHHTWFNIAAYIAIFTMMFFFEKTDSTLQKKI